MAKMKPALVTAKLRKRCPICRVMIEAGEQAWLTDDRYSSERLQDFGRRHPRGAFHLTHDGACADARGLRTPKEV